MESYDKLKEQKNAIMEREVKSIALEWLVKELAQSAARRKKRYDKAATRSLEEQAVQRALVVMNADLEEDYRSLAKKLTKV
jgi:hypothetical protein